jgi:outer membrane lipoprotein-sorting protein
MTIMINKYKTIIAKTILIWGMVFLVLIVSGCPPQLGPVPEPLTRQEGLESYNANVNAVVSFKAAIAEWEVEFPDEKEKKKHFEELVWGGSIIYRPPVSWDVSARFRLEARAPFETAFVLGSNEDEFWMYSELAEHGGWGKYQHLGKSCSNNVLIPPQLILEFIGLRPIPDQPPFPVYKIYPETHVFEYIDVDDEGYSSKREIVIDRRSNLPVEINAYSSEGQRIMHSELQDYKPLADAMLPTSIFLSWPNRDTFIRLKIRSYKVDEKDRSKLFVRPTKISGIKDYQQIDESCEKVNNQP